MTTLDIVLTIAAITFVSRSDAAAHRDDMLRLIGFALAAIAATKEMSPSVGLIVSFAIAAYWLLCMVVTFLSWRASR